MTSRRLKSLGKLFTGTTAALVVALALIVIVYRPHVSPALGHGHTGAAQAERLRASVESFPPFRSTNHPEALSAMEHQTADALRKLGWRVELQPVQHAQNSFVSPHPRYAAPETHNLIATRGDPATARRWVLAAHIDSVSPSPGADDDGSGVAVLLELARILPDAAAQDVELCFFNEEENGLYGSYTFVTALGAASRQHVHAAFVLDMVGAFDTRPHSQAYPPPLSWLAPDRGDFLAAIALTDADADLNELLDARGRTAPELAFTVFEPSRILADAYPDIWRSDHAPFWDAHIPAVFITDTGEFRSHTYHSSGDVAGRLDYERMAALTDALAEVVAR